MRPLNVKCDAQTALDQDGDCRAVSIGPGTGSPISVRVDAPLELDVSLAPQAELAGNKLADKPSAAPHLVGLCIAKVEPLAVAHSQFGAQMTAAELPTGSRRMSPAARQEISAAGGG
jgi:hypothetical protein